MASACFWIMGSVLERFERSRTVRTPMTATLTMTMKTISSSSVTPPARRRSVIHIARLRGDDDHARRVVRVGAVQRNGGGCAWAAEAVEAERASARRRQRYAARCGLGLQRVCRVHRMRHVSRRGRTAIVAGDGAHLCGGDAHEDRAPPGDRRFLREAHDGLRLVVEAPR